jgi:hypothetical protein
MHLGAPGLHALLSVAGGGLVTLLVAMRLAGRVFGGCGVRHPQRTCGKHCNCDSLAVTHLLSFT